MGKEVEKAGLPAWSLLAVAIAEARFGDRGSEWEEYAQALPKSTGSILEWTADEVSAPYQVQQECFMVFCKKMLYGARDSQPSSSGEYIVCCLGISVFKRGGEGPYISYKFQSIL